MVHILVKKKLAELEQKAEKARIQADKCWNCTIFQEELNEKKFKDFCQYWERDPEDDSCKNYEIYSFYNNPSYNLKEVEVDTSEA